MKNGEYSSIFKRIMVTLTGSAPTAMRSWPGCRGKIQFYAFLCPVNGVVENYPAEHSLNLVCPECSEEPAK